MEATTIWTIIVLLIVGLALFVGGRKLRIMLMQQHELQRQISQLEQLLAIERQKTQALLGEREHLSGVVSHDLKSPFNRLFALVQLFAFEKDGLTAVQQDYLSRIQQVASDGLGMVKNLLDYRKLLTSDMKFVPEKFDVSALIHTLLKQYKLLGDRKGIAVECDGPPGIDVRTDKTCLTRVLDNLVANAVKFSPIGAKVAISWMLQDSQVCIAVTDQGPGFKTEEMPLAYEPFRKYSAKPTGGESTTGLGLYISKQMVDRMQGKMRCETAESGTVFSFLLAVEQAAS